MQGPILKDRLDHLYGAFNYPDSATDPIQVVRRFKRADDREVVGFCAAALAFGRVASVLQSIERLVAIMGDRPADYVRRFDPVRERPAFRDLVHRWSRPDDLVALVWVLRQMFEEAGSIEGFFMTSHEPDAVDIEAGLDGFARRALLLDLRRAYGKVPRAPGVAYFFTRPSGGSACKRLNLFLRWMVRRDSLDLGVWSGVRPSQLIVPLDTHVIRVGRCLKLTTYKSPGWPMARQITASLRRFDAEDPIKYDFSLCHIGMMNACGFDRSRSDSQCPLAGVCAPGPKRRASVGSVRL